MEFSWSALWNITDETPDNCQMFLNCSGMNLFLDCLKVPNEYQKHLTRTHSGRKKKKLSTHPSCFLPPQEFPDKQELHRNMLGLLGNVAEVKELRPQLLTSQFVTVFRCSVSTHPSESQLPNTVKSILKAYVILPWAVTCWGARRMGSRCRITPAGFYPTSCLTGLMCGLWRTLTERWSWTKCGTPSRAGMWPRVATSTTGVCFTPRLQARTLAQRLMHIFPQR